jgi:hypothetical protein
MIEGIQQGMIHHDRGEKQQGKNATQNIKNMLWTFKLNATLAE